MATSPKFRTICRASRVPVHRALPNISCLAAHPRDRYSQRHFGSSNWSGLASVAGRSRHLGGRAFRGGVGRQTRSTIRRRSAPPSAHSQHVERVRVQC